MGCESSKQAGALQTAHHHPDGKAHVGGWKPKSKKYQRAIGNREAAPLLADTTPAPARAEFAVPHLSATRDGDDAPAVAAAMEAAADVDRDNTAGDDASNAPALKAAAGHDVAAPGDEPDAPAGKVVTDGEVVVPDGAVVAHAIASESQIYEVASPMAGGFAVHQALDETSMPPGGSATVSTHAQDPPGTDMFGRCASASKQLWPFMCPGDAALIVEDAVLFGGRDAKDDKSKVQDHAARHFPVFTCTPHCRRSCSAGSEAEISTECGTQIAAY